MSCHSLAVSGELRSEAYTHSTICSPLSKRRAAIFLEPSTVRVARFSGGGFLSCRISRVDAQTFLQLQRPRAILCVWPRGPIMGSLAVWKGREAHQIGCRQGA